MARLHSTCSLLALALLSQYVIAHPQITPAPIFTKQSPSCYSFTETVPYTGIINCPAEPVSCPAHPDCIRLVETTLQVPCPNSKCPVTPTVTVTGLPGLECPKCQTGCATQTRTVTALYACPLETAK